MYYLFLYLTESIDEWRWNGSIHCRGCVQGVVVCVCWGRNGNRFVSFAELCSEHCCNDTAVWVKATILLTCTGMHQSHWTRAVQYAYCHITSYLKLKTWLKKKKEYILVLLYAVYCSHGQQSMNVLYSTLINVLRISPHSWFL